MTRIAGGASEEGAGPARAYTGRFYMRFSANPCYVRCPRRGGGGAGWSGDACVALGGRVPHLHAGDSLGTQGDASVPTLLYTTPAPTRTIPHPKPPHEKPTRVSPQWIPLHLQESHEVWRGTIKPGILPIRLSLFKATSQEADGSFPGKLCSLGMIEIRTILLEEPVLCSGIDIEAHFFPRAL